MGFGGDFGGRRRGYFDIWQTARIFRHMAAGPSSLHSRERWRTAPQRAEWPGSAIGWLTALPRAR